jgi:LPXTG-site transpeptidase (sortase) family protein
LLDAVEYILFAAWLIALVLFAWWEVDGRYHQAIYQREIAEALAARNAPETGGRSRELAAVSDGPFGRLRCPRIGLDVAVVNGLDNTTLRRAAGRLPRSGPNIVIAAHRDTYFRPLKEISEGDQITLETLDGKTRIYSVRSIEITDPSEVGWMHQTESPVLTLITCYPFNWVGPAPQRVVVRAEAS